MNTANYTVCSDTETEKNCRFQYGTFHQIDKHAIRTKKLRNSDTNTD